MSLHMTKDTIKRDMVPGPRDNRRAGKLYESRMIDYANRFWRPEVGRQGSPSLHRTILALERLHETWNKSLL
jgi:hypothetical protein